MRFGFRRAICLGICILMLSGCSFPQPVMTLPEYILHAGGVTPDNRIGTNSIEALDASYRSGFFWIELDFNQTSDGHFVCLHDWQSTYSINLTGLAAPDLETFEAYRKTTYGYESPTLDSLILWMDAHPNALIVTDVKSDNLAFASYVSQHYPDHLDRFIVQIYHSEEYDHVSKCGFDKIIYTLYNEPHEKKYDIDNLRLFVNDNDHLIALAYADAREHADQIAQIADLGVPVYIHTINNPDDRLFWKNHGAYGFYCDFP